CIEPNHLTVVALDGYRLAIMEKEVLATKEINIIIPQKTLAELTKLITDDDDIVHIAANRRYVVFSTSTYVIMSRLIEGDFLDFRRVVPEGYKTRVVVDTRDFINSIERASLIITERLKNPLRITFDQNITVRCQTALGKVVDEIEAEIEGETVEIGFNNRYLLDALRYSACDKVVFEINGPLSPVKVLPVEGNEFLFLVLPVRFKND
ncbi:MAG: DNA polymerase III subunit beta, partial [Ruthenibacterium sp.]